MLASLSKYLLIAAVLWGLAGTGATCYYRSEAKRFQAAFAVQQGQTEAANAQAESLKASVQTLVAACRAAVDKPDVFWNELFKFPKNPPGTVRKGGLPGKVPGPVR